MTRAAVKNNRACFGFAASHINKNTDICLLTHSEISQELSDIFLAVGVGIELIRSVQGRPFGLLLEKAHCLDVLYRTNMISHSVSQSVSRSQRKREGGKKVVILTLVSSVVKRW